MILSKRAVATLLAAAAVLPASVAFSPTSSRATALRTRTWSTTSRGVASVSPPAPSIADRTVTTTTKKSDDSLLTNKPVGWDCDDAANCVEVDPCDEVKCRTSLDVRIHGQWYDLSGWRKAHPAGAHWIDWYDGRDATEVMDAFHSAKARKMWSRLPKSAEETVMILEAEVPADSSTQMNFRKLQKQLEDDGWYERDPIYEIKLLGIFGGLCVGAAATAHTVPAASIMLTALAMTNAGWLGHDYVHGVDQWSTNLRQFVSVAAGLGPTWWSDKHNKHHALTNEMGVDEDIATDPFIYPYVPSPENDNPLRRIQHWIFFIPFSFLFALWRFDTLKVAVDAVEEKRTEAKKELFCLMGHYLILLSVLPPQIWLPAVFISGLMSALIVTPTHQSEAMFDEYQPDWVQAQFMSTRNGVMSNPFSEWLWGGMQYQLEHHLFPSMPRMNYPKLKGILTKFAEDNKIPGGYRESDEFDVLYMNWDLYRKVAQQDAVPGSPSSRGDGQLGSIDAEGKGGVMGGLAK